MDKTSVIIILLLALGCTEPSKENLPALNLFQKAETNQQLSEIAIVDSIKSIRIANFQNFGEVKRGFILDSLLLLHTSSPTTLTAVDKNGNVVGQIIPDYEITGITGIDTYKGNIYILHKSAFKIYVVDMGLNLLEEISIPVSSQSFKMIRDHIVALYTGNEISDKNEGKLILFDFRENKILKDLIPISERERKYFNFLTTYHFIEYSNETYFWDSAIDTMFTLQGAENPTSGLILDYGSNGVPSDFYENNSFENVFEFITEMRKTNYAFRHFRVISNHRRLMVSFEKGGEFVTGLFGGRQSYVFKGLNDDVATMNSLEDLFVTGFFTTLYKDSSFIAYIPYELIHEEAEVHPILKTTRDSGHDALMYGRLR